MNVSPERRQDAATVLQEKYKRKQAGQQRAATEQYYESEGMPKSLAGTSEDIQKEAIKAKGKGSATKMNPEVQKWAYKELEKKAPIQALNNSLAELKRLNKSGVTGPVSGITPAWLANKEADAIRKAIDANAIQILNVHKSMFPRGLTQGEFNTLGKKLVSSSNSQSANDAIINAYERLAKLQESKVNAVEQAVQQYGFDPMLPFMVSGIQKQFDEQEAEENRKLYQQVMGKSSPDKEKKEPSSGKIKLKHKVSGQMGDVPAERFSSLSEEEKQLYERIE
jgi:hypothetical protein